MKNVDISVRSGAKVRRREISVELEDCACLYYLTNFSEIHFDSEWHAFCECPGFAAARSRFCFNTALQINCSTPCTVDDLCSLVAAVAGSASLSGELARFALNIRSSRRHLFRQLSSDGPSGRALVAARSAALLA